MIERIVAALAHERFLLDDEKSVQADIADALARAGIAATREVPLRSGVIDLVAGEIGIEVKLQGQRAAILRQIKGYLRDERIKGLVLVTSRAVAFGPLIEGKPLRIVDMGKAWL